MMCASLAISGISVHVRVLQQGCDFAGCLRACAVDVLVRRAHGGHDGVLCFPRMLLAFFGEYRGHAHPHESPLVMTGPLMILAALSLAGGFYQYSTLAGADVRRESEAKAWHGFRRA